MENLLRINYFFSTIIKLNSISQKFFHQHGYVKLQDVEAGEISSLEHTADGTLVRGRAHEDLAGELAAYTV